MNREAELEPPSRVACSDLLDHMLMLMSHLRRNQHIGINSKINHILLQQWT